MKRREESRPERQVVTDELGSRKSLPDEAHNFKMLSSGGGRRIFFGLGPDPRNLKEYFPGSEGAFYVECPDFTAQIPSEKSGLHADGFIRLTPDELDKYFTPDMQAVLYEPNLRLFPSFWLPIHARVLQYFRRLAGKVAPAENILVVGAENGLLVREIESAFRNLGHAVRSLDGEEAIRKLPEIADLGAKLFLSLNFHGFDTYGSAAYLLREAGIPVAVWCVDNPFHLISRFRSVFWRDVPIFVTDKWFVPVLAEHGVKSVRYLPLAAGREVFHADERQREFEDLQDKVVFVGRPEFPGRRKFFSGCRVSDERWGEAQEAMLEGARPDFSWWWEKYGRNPLWPGLSARNPGFAAEECGKAFRTACLNAVGASGRLVAYGGDAWRNLLDPGAETRAVVDYYAQLPGIYSKAAFSLNMTGFLLPSGLTQRHFDVWAAGGFLLTDATPGLELFPAELSREISFNRPEEILPLVEKFEENPGLKKDIAHAFREIVLKKHVYEERLSELLNNIV